MVLISSADICHIPGCWDVKTIGKVSRKLSVESVASINLASVSKGKVKEISEIVSIFSTIHVNENSTRCEVSRVIVDAGIWRVMALLKA